MKKIKENYYLRPGEVQPAGCAIRKCFIGKMMFTAAVACPLYGDGKKRLNHRKAGIWPFVYEEPAKRNVKNRQKGTMETKIVSRVTKSVVCKMLVDNVIPAIKKNGLLQGGRKN